MNLAKAFTVPSLLWRLRTTPDQPQDLVDFVFDSKLICPLQVREELLVLADIVGKLRPKVVLEIGTARGGTLCVLSRLADPNATIVSVDLPSGQFGGGYKWFHIPIFKRFPRRGQKLHLLRGDSHGPEMLRAVREVLGQRTLDLLFIDGDHSYDGVKQDFEKYMPLVTQGGMVVLHDIAPHVLESCQVARFWNELKTRYKTQEIIENQQQGWAGIGLVYV